jgi:hypothetical protein
MLGALDLAGGTLPRDELDAQTVTMLDGATPTAVLLDRLGTFIDTYAQHVDGCDGRGRVRLKGPVK